MAPKRTRDSDESSSDESNGRIRKKDYWKSKTRLIRALETTLAMAKPRGLNWDKLAKAVGGKELTASSLRGKMSQLVDIGQRRLDDLDATSDETSKRSGTARVVNNDNRDRCPAESQRGGSGSNHQSKKRHGWQSKRKRKDGKAPNSNQPNDNTNATRPQERQPTVLPILTVPTASSQAVPFHGGNARQMTTTQFLLLDPNFAAQTSMVAIQPALHTR